MIAFFVPRNGEKTIKSKPFDTLYYKTIYKLMNYKSVKHH